VTPEPTRIPFVDLALQNGPILDDAIARVRRVIEHGHYILGPEVGELECELAGYLGVDHVVGVGNGTDALVLALRAHGIGEGDEVILPSHTFLASAAAVCLVGARPVFADIDPETMLLSPACAEERIGPQTRAIMPVHLNGFPCDMPAFVALAERHDLVLIEDAAQSLGACRDGRKTGSFGTGCFSLHPLKVMGACGDAGFVSTSDEALAERLRQDRNLGLRNRDEAAGIAGNSRLDTLQAAILLAKLPRLEDWIGARNAHARRYRAGLDGLVKLPPEAPGVRPIDSPFVIRVETGRDRLQKRLDEAGIDSKVHYPIPVHRQQPYRVFHDAPLPETERLVTEILSLPCSPELSPEQCDRVIDVIQQELG
jgi:dTDP-4-amino-4,6-dideoxygalactose transaminase